MVLLLGLFVIGIAAATAEDVHKVHCSKASMVVDIILPQGSENNDSPQIYLEGMKGYPNAKCLPTVANNVAQFTLSLEDFYECGVTRVINKITGKKVFYHKITIETNDSKEFVSVKCITMASPTYNVTRHSHSIARRDLLPVGFEEPIDLGEPTLVEKMAPLPNLTMMVRQGGEIVTGELNVMPGTPLAMEIALNQESVDVYGLGVTYMQVTDTKSQEETIIFNGCSVDPFLFDNFNTVDGDLLTARFRAFKFPESTYVQFRGTVNVCLQNCDGVQCSNGNIGYGRRRRSIISSNPEPNKIYEISMTTFIKVVNDADGNQGTASELEQKLQQLKIANQKLERNSRGSIFETVQDHKTYAEHNDGAAAAIVEETTLIRLQQGDSGVTSMMDSASAGVIASEINGSTTMFTSSMTTVAMLVLLVLKLTI